MKKSIVWNDEINKELVELLSNTLNEMQDEGELTFYLTSGGGLISAEQILLDLIENTKTDIKIVVTGRLCSSAFSLFFRAECKKKILSGTIGMFHSAQVSIDLNHHGNPAYGEGVAYKKMMRTEDKVFAAELCDLVGMTVLQKSKVMKGEDVYFITDEMQKFLETVESKNLKTKTFLNKNEKT